ncbi:MAG: 16S rRNA processing protein RimM [Spirochaetales bacterium]|nr:16S rRNA processing protein RimM [Spirochaetales bacterium]
MDKLVIGRLGAPFGVRGHLKLRSSSGEYGHIARLAELELRLPDGRPARLRVAELVDAPGGAAVRFEGVDSPEAARPYVNAEILAARADAAPLADNEWYVDDLVGCVLEYEGIVAASVIAVTDGAADPLLETRLPDGRTALVPFRKEFVGEVDVADKRIELLAPWILE